MEMFASKNAKLFWSKIIITELQLNASNRLAVAFLDLKHQVGHKSRHMLTKTV